MSDDRDARLQRHLTACCVEYLDDSRWIVDGEVFDVADPDSDADPIILASQVDGARFEIDVSVMAWRTPDSDHHDKGAGR